MGSKTTSHDFHYMDQIIYFRRHFFNYVFCFTEDWMTCGWVNDNRVCILGELSLQVVLSIYFWSHKQWLEVLVHVSWRLLWACKYHEIRFMQLAFNFLFGFSWASWKKPFKVCLGVTGVAVWVLFLFVHWQSMQHTVSQAAKSLSFS